MKKAGRPSTFTRALADEICDLICGGDSLLQVAHSFDPENPRSFYRYILRHLASDEEFCRNYARAKELSGDADSDYIIFLAHAVVAGKVDANSANVAINAMKWTAARKQPKKYGDKVQQEISGKDGAPIEAAITVQFVKSNAGDPG